MEEQPDEKESKYLYEIDSLKKDEIDLSQVLLDIQNLKKVKNLSHMINLF